MHEVSLGKTFKQKNIDVAATIMTWNRWFLSGLGVWPENPNNFLILINFTYFIYNMLCEYLDLFHNIDNLEQVIENLTENMAFTQILVRMGALLVYNSELGDVISEVFKDYDGDVYKDEKESRIFLGYMVKAKLFVKICTAFTTMTATSYYAKPLMSLLAVTFNGEITNAFNISSNLTGQFILPYRFYLFHEVTDFRTYVITYVSQFPFVIISGLGQMASLSLMVTLTFHVSGKLSILVMRISDLSPGIKHCKKELEDIIIEHNRLLKMGQMIEEAFNAALLIYLSGVTSLVCILGYQLLANYAKGQGADLVTFIVYISLVFIILYAHGVVGESLITESNRICEAYYDCLWYEMPPDVTKNIIFCIERSQKPLGLTAGKFFPICLSTMTSVVKTAMGYLSILRSFLLS